MYFNPDVLNISTSSTSAPPINTAPPKIGNWSAVGPRLGSANSSKGDSRNASNSINSSPSTANSMVWGSSTPQPIIHSPRRSQAKQSVAPYPSPATADKNVTRKLFQAEVKKSGGFGVPPQSSSNTTVSYSYPANSTTKISPGLSTFMAKAEMKVASSKANSANRQKIPGPMKTMQTQPNISAKIDPQPLPIINNQQSTGGIPMSTIDGLASLPPNSIPTGMQHLFSPFNNPFSNVADVMLGGKKDDAADRMNFASVAAAGVVPPVTNSPPSEMKADPNLQAKAPGFRTMNKNTDIDALQAFYMMKNVVTGGGFVDPELARAPGYRIGMPNQSPSMSPRSGSSQSGGHSPRNMDPNQQMGASLLSLANQKDEYTTATQPMTLPKIESTLNPNAPQFTSRQPGQPGPSSGPGSVPNLPAGYLQLYQQALAQQLIQQAAPGMNISF